MGSYRFIINSMGRLFFLCRCGRQRPPTFHYSTLPGGPRIGNSSGRHISPLNAILLGVMVLGERLEWHAFVGMGLIFIGLIAIDGRLLKRFKRKETAWYYEI